MTTEDNHSTPRVGSFEFFNPAPRGKGTISPDFLSLLLAVPSFYTISGAALSEIKTSISSILIEWKNGWDPTHSSVKCPTLM